MSDKLCVLQDDLKDCGICCLLSIIKYYNGEVPRPYLRELTKTSKQGVSAYNLLKAARELGFESAGYKAQLKDLKEIELPIIAHVLVEKKLGHFVVIYKINYQKNEILLMDPSKGFVWINFIEFQKISSKYFLIIQKKYAIPNIKEDNLKDKIIINNLLDKKKILIFILFISLISTILNIITSYHFKLLFNKNNSLKTIFVVLIILEITKNIFNYFRNYLITEINSLLDKSLVRDAFNHIIRLPYLYYKNHTNGDLLTRINDLGNIKTLMSQCFVSVFVDLLLALIVLFFLCKINILLTGILIISIILYALIVCFFNKKMQKSIQDNYQKISFVNNYLIESLASFETIKNFSIEKYIQKRFNKEYYEYTIMQKKLINKINVQNLFKDLVIAISSIFIIYLGINRVNNNILSLTSLITFISLENYLLMPIKNTLDLQLVYLNTKQSLRRIKELYQIPEENNLFNGRYIKDLKGNIDIYNVSFSYNNHDNVLNNVSLSIKEKDKILIYGHSGCGKSTLMQLLIKYIDGNFDGNIIINGYDLNNLDVYTLRQNICYVSQQEYLYTDSIYNNVTLGNKIKYKDFLTIMHNTFVDEIIKGDLIGFNYLLENNGENISGGEKSRILIARSLMKKANIYIYDETFSTLDIEKERKILMYLFEVLKDKTIIVIGHRLSNEDLFNQKIKVGD